MPEVTYTYNGEVLEGQELYARMFNMAKVPQSILDTNYDEWA